jgi:hypothetical protein
MKAFSLRACGGLFFLLLFLSVLCTNVHAQSEAEPSSDLQWWPDTSLSVSLNEQLTCAFFITVRPGRNVSAVVNRQFGVGLSWAIKPNLSSSVQYRHILSDPTEQRHAEEHRLHLDLTPRFALGKGITLVNRTRAEYRRINGAVSGRFRDRLQFEKDLSLREYRLTPYVAGETYFDTRSHTLNRNQVYVGSRLPVNKHLTLDAFYMHQWDARTKPGYWHIIGTFLRFEL